MSNRNNSIPSSSESESDLNLSDVESTTTNHFEYKEQGNDSYKSGDYRSAIHQYSLAIDAAFKILNKEEDDDDEHQDGTNKRTTLKQELASYHSNRAAASTMILRYDDALFDCDRAIELDPTFVKSRIRKARIFTTLGRLNEASDVYGRAMVYDPNDASLVKARDEVKTLLKRFNLMRELLSVGGNGSNGDYSKQHQKKSGYPYLPIPPIRNSQQALKQVMLILSSSPEWNELLFYKVRALVYLHNNQEAYALTTTLIRRSSSSSLGGNRNGEGSDSNLLLLRAHCLFCMGNLNDAVKHARQILTGDPDHKDAFVMHKLFKSLGKQKEEADRSYKAGNYKESVDLYTEALELCPGKNSSKEGGLYRAKLYFNRASALSNLRNHIEVVLDCTRALRLDSEYVKAYTRRASSNLLINDGDDDAEKHCQSAIRDYEKALELSSSSSNNESTVEELKKKIRAAKVQLKRCKQKDFYKILNVARDASDGEIKKSYRKAALKWHPDRHSNSSEEEKSKAEKTFRDVNLAYEVLSDPEKKKKYDSGVDEQDLDNPHAGQGLHHGGIDPQVLFQMFMQQQGGGGASFSF